MWEGTWKIFFASKPLDANDESYCYPNPFNPRQEELKIKYSTGGSEANVTIRIFDFSFNYVRTVIQNVSRNRDLEGTPEFWDGKDDNGNYVPNGVYFYRVEVGDNDGVYGKILVMQ
jgi:flagellar hook assembly protein FlgD